MFAPKALPVLLGAVLFGATLVGCTPVDRIVEKPKADASESTPAEEADPTFAEPVDEPEPVDLNSAFGDAIVYGDGVSISVSPPTPFTPGEYASGATQASNVVFSITITNGSDKNLIPYPYATASSAGAEASSVFDSENPVGELSSGPSTAILPGDTISWLVGFSLADPADVVFQIAPSFDYDNAIFTNK